MGNGLSDEQRRGVLQGLPDVLTILDDSGRIEWVSPSCERHLGRQQSALLGTQLSEHVHPADRQAVATTIEAASTGEDNGSTQTYRFEHATGDWVWLEASVGSAAGASDGIIVTNRPLGDNRDGTSVDEAERNDGGHRGVVHTDSGNGDAGIDTVEDDVEQLTLLNQVIRHDLRNDLDVALTWLDHLDGTDESAMAADRVRSACMHMIELTDNARDYAQMITSDESLATRPIHLPTVIETEIERRRELYPDAAFVVDGSIPDVDLWANDLLGSVFRNVLNNAAQHSERETPEIVVSATAAESSVEIRIADDGPGIDEKTKVAVQSTDDADIDDSRTGVGLAITTGLVEAFDGDLDVRDNDPTGTVVVITLPTIDGDAGGCGETGR